MENQFHSNSCPRKGRPKLEFAALLILAGMCFLGFNLGWIPIVYKPILLSWQMLLIVIGIFSFFKKKILGGLLLVSVGLFFLFSTLANVFPFLQNNCSFDIHLYWPILLIIAGVLFIFKKGSCKSGKDFNYTHSTSESNSYNEADYISKHIMFSSSEQIVFSPEFRGGELKVVFGEIRLDLRKVVTLDDKNQLNVEVLFGSVIIYAPTDCSLNLKSSTMFGDVQDKRLVTDKHTDNKTFVLNIKSSCLFGSIEIR